MTFVRQSDFFDLLDPAKSAAGKKAYLAGRAAEDAVERLYQDRGFTLAARRWRKGRCGGEIDLIFRHGANVVFVEVKKARNFAFAAERIGQRQQARIAAGAAAFLADEPAGSLTDCRFDVALVDGIGRIQVIENAFTG